MLLGGDNDNKENNYELEAGTELILFLLINEFALRESLLTQLSFEIIVSYWIA